ncbi:MAG: AraC family transcriptional regulator [Puniceicoccaceae bacterium]|nr:MAG: AraC family transcriptional regulator [Puniceicoccaceae bacterium]
MRKIESLIKNMENFFKHWDPTPRAYPGILPVTALGYYAAKEEVFDREFFTCNFSLIFQGSGEYRVADRSFTIDAPCVLLQWPDTRFTYGHPPGASKRWEEFFIIYPAHLQKTLAGMGFFTAGNPIYPLANPAAARRTIEEIRILCQSRRAEHVVDRVDRLCEQILLDTRLVGGGERHGETVIEHIHEALTDRYNEAIDLVVLAREYGLSTASFRRLWKERYSEPPWQYLLSLRIRAACGLLVETGLPVQAIAAEVGFEDPLYFSRRFRSVMGMSPRHYRKRNGLGLSL